MFLTVSIDDHRAKLPNSEKLAMQTAADLAVKNRAGTIELHCDRDGNCNNGYDRQPRDRSQNVNEALQLTAYRAVGFLRETGQDNRFF